MLSARECRPAIGTSVTAMSAAAPSATTPARPPAAHQPMNPAATSASIPTSVANPGSRERVDGPVSNAMW